MTDKPKTLEDKPREVWLPADEIIAITKEHIESNWRSAPQNEKSAALVAFQSGLARGIAIGERRGLEMAKELAVSRLVIPGCPCPDATAEFMIESISLLLEPAL